MYDEMAQYIIYKTIHDNNSVVQVDVHTFVDVAEGFARKESSKSSLVKVTISEISNHIPLQKRNFI